MERPVCAASPDETLRHGGRALGHGAAEHQARRQWQQAQDQGHTATAASTGAVMDEAQAMAVVPANAAGAPAPWGAGDGGHDGTSVAGSAGKRRRRTFLWRR